MITGANPKYPYSIAADAKKGYFRDKNYTLIYLVQSTERNASTLHTIIISQIHATKIDLTIINIWRFVFKKLLTDAFFLATIDII